MNEYDVYLLVLNDPISTYMIVVRLQGRWVDRRGDEVATTLLISPVFQLRSYTASTDAFQRLRFHNLSQETHPNADREAETSMSIRTMGPSTTTFEASIHPISDPA